MQDETPIAPVGAGTGHHGLAADRQIGRLGGTDERGDLTLRDRGPVGAASLCGTWKAGDAPAPGIGGLHHAAIGVGQRIVLRHIHHDERVQHDGQAARLQIANGRDDGGVGRRSAISGPAFDPADEASIGALAHQPADLPGRCFLADMAFGDTGSQGALARAQIVAKPRHDQRNMFEVRADRLQFIDRGGPVIARIKDVAIVLDGLTRAQPAGGGVWRKAVLGCTGDDRDGRQARFDFADRPDHFGLDLRNAVAEILERQPFEHQIGDVAVSRRVPRALLCLKQRVGRLAGLAGVDAHGDLGQVDLAPVRPDALDHGHRPLAQGHRDIAEIGVGGGRGLRAALDALTPGRRLFLEPGRPDNRAGEPHMAIGTRNRRALLGGHRALFGQTRPLDMLAGTEQPLVDPVAGKRPGSGTDGGAKRAECAAQQSTGGLKQKRCHQCVPER